MTCVDISTFKQRELARLHKNPAREQMLLEFRLGERTISKEDAQSVGIDWYCENELLQCGHIGRQLVEDDSCLECHEWQRLDIQQMLS